MQMHATLNTVAFARDMTWSRGEGVPRSDSISRGRLHGHVAKQPMRLEKMYSNAAALLRVILSLAKKVAITTDT